MTKPGKIIKDPKDYEKVSTEDFVTGMIDKVQVDEKHTFKFEGKESVKPAIRLKFVLDGYQYPHYSRWMTFSYGEKSALFKKYLLPLVEGATPDFDFDIEALEGMKVKMLWSEKNGFFSVETIRPIGSKLVVGSAPEPAGDAQEEPPF